ncbi:MAG: ferritin-like domain-containing protein [Deltaproteobacteria bacterium]|nr:ferritin-like domain-containing protein [Deltaproteobacteria bacterium]
MSSDRLVTLFSYYRDAELRGATLLLKLLQRMNDDGGAQVKLTKHLEDEVRHAWLWTKRISDLGGVPEKVDDGYQRRIGLEVGIPRTLEQLLALTIVVEERALSRYLAHAAAPGVDPETLAVLHEVTKDERWHLSWIEHKLREIAGPAAASRVDDLLARYREVDRRVFADLERKERTTFGFSVADTPAS